jgi:acyl-CoA synthetase (AMP-forming)/AMP-acid ligase II/pimeloyl-ACP methyl ester carboxylesterase
VVDTSALAALLPYESKYLVIDGVRLHYLDEGQGPVVLMLHGNPTWCFYYRNLIREFRDRFRVIVPDYIGCGLSDHPTDRHYRAKDRIDHLERLLDHLGVKTFSLLMHDWGGPIGTGLAVRRLPAVERLVYLNTTLTETESLPLIIKKAASPLIGRFLTKYTGHFVRLTTDFGVRRTLAPEVRSGYHLPYQTAERRTAIWDFVDDIPFDANHPSYATMMEIAHGLPDVAKKPVQIIWGLKDPCFHREMLSRVAAHFPSARVLEIPDASHLVLEDAFEQVSSVAKSFLSGDEVTANPAGVVSHTPKRPPGSLYGGFLDQVAARPLVDAAIVPIFWGSQVRYAHVSYRDLGNLVHKYQRGLTELGVVPGDRVLMLVPAGVEFLALSYAVMGRGAVPIFIDPGIGRENLLRCIADAEPTVMIGSPKAQLLRLIGKAALRTVRINILAADPVIGSGPNLGYLKKFSSVPMAPVPAGEVGFIAFTSGATGVPKGVIFSDQMLAEHRRIFAGPLGLEAGAKDLPLLPIFSLFNVSIGVTSVFFPINASKPLTLEPDRVTKVIADLGVRYSFGSPTLWKKIAEYCFRTRSDLPTIEKIFMAGAPVPADTLARVQGIIPQGMAYTPYGATEALPVTIVSSTEIMSAAAATRARGGEEGTYVGAPVPGVEIKIVKTSSGAIESLDETEELPPLEIGEVIVRGRNVSPAYLNRPKETTLAKIGVGEGFWHRMGDMGYLDARGHLYFCGRKAHVVGALERTYYSIPTEIVFNRSPKVRRSALVDLGQGRAGVVIEPEPHHWPETDEARATFSDEIKALGAANPLTKEITEFFFHRSFPVDARHNAKIYRDRLGVWAREQEASRHASPRVANG